MESATSLDAISTGLLGFGHPIRIRALVLLETEQSPRALAEVMGEPLGVTSYHVRMLREYGLVAQSRTEPRRGALAHFYVRTELANKLLRVLREPLELPSLKGPGGIKRRRELLETWAAAPHGIDGKTTAA